MKYGHIPVSVQLPLVELKIGEWGVPFTECLITKFFNLKINEAFYFREVRFERR